MMTIVTLKKGREPEWDAAMHKRLDAARDQPGWIGGRLLLPLDRPNHRVTVGTWETRAAWEAWHLEPAFVEARAQLDDLEIGKPEQWWHAVILDVRPV